MSLFDRRALFRGFNADAAHQRMAGLASWAAFSARWRARQGLPLLHPMDVQYLTPQDFCNGSGRPFSPEVQRRLFREYVAAAVQTAVSDMTGRRRRCGLLSADIALMRSDGFIRRLWLQHQDFQYGRPDMGPYEQRADRPYGVPLASDTAQCYWLDGSEVGDEDENGDKSWIEERSALDRASHQRGGAYD
jgi:hypothetical protein